MTIWRRPFASRLLAGLLAASLAWALLATHAFAYGAMPSNEGQTSLVQSLDLPATSHQAEPGFPCEPQAACSPTLFLQQVAAPAFVAPWRSLHVRPWDDRRTHLHRHGHEPPPPRHSA